MIVKIELISLLAARSHLSYWYAIETSYQSIVYIDFASKNNGILNSYYSYIT